MASPLAWILATGAVGPLGLTGMQIAMCARARKMEPFSSDLVDRRGYSMGYCRAFGLPDALAGHDRLLALAAPALAQASPPGIAGEVPLVLALPEAGRADDDPRLAGGVIGALAARGGARIDAARSRVIRAGHAGGAIAIEAAVEMLGRSDGPAMVMVGGVDSYAHPGVLAALDRDDRLHAPGVEDGFVPSEGAAFLLLARRPDLVAGRRPIAAVRAVATGRESSAGTDEPNLARAMTRAAREASNDGAVGWVLNDVNGESHRVREWTMVETRVFPAGNRVIQRLVDDLGDLGAATGPTLAVIACCSWAAGAAPARDGLVALHSDGAERGAFCLEEVAS